jgi:hypothetical protein
MATRKPASTPFLSKPMCNCHGCLVASCISPHPHHDCEVPLPPFSPILICEPLLLPPPPPQGTNATHTHTLQPPARTRCRSQNYAWPHVLLSASQCSPQCGSTARSFAPAPFLHAYVMHVSCNRLSIFLSVKMKSKGRAVSTNEPCASVHFLSEEFQGVEATGWATGPPLEPVDNTQVWLRAAL